ncbi:ankyrin repeat domain-containing protein [Acidovorax sp. SUPP3334]|uniref:ankyrin repeat domain-containing protein n=1 Tax=Acidovorax sp. SUPP3334 TaxID=2920881 RepID=UPI0023DE4F8F|nr:ankyrin repeat domain-containing protein [Acidovorax sp. SUPP3334]GKT21383.1 ankyrin repeat domain-containing protein [Acidovorax sp. SUPP3334]
MQITKHFHNPPRATTAAQPYAGQEAVRYEPSRDGTSIKAFEKSGRGKQLMTQYRAGIGKLKTFLEEHPSAKSQQSITALDIFKSRVEGGSTGHYSTQISRLYDEGKASLDTLCMAVADHAIPLSTRMDIIENLASGLLVCSEGTTTNLIMATQDLNLTKGLHTYANRVWEDMLDQALRDFSHARHKGLANYEGNEIHYVNGYRNFLAERFGVAERSDSFVDVQTVSAHVQEAAAFAEARVNTVELVRHLAQECLSEVHERFRQHLGRPLTLETAGQLHKEYGDSLEAGLQGRFGAIPAWVVITEHEPTGEEDAPYSILENPALLMRVIAKNMQKQGLIDKEKFEVVDSMSTAEGDRKIKRIGDGDFYIKERDAAGGTGYRSLRLSDLSAAMEWPAALLMSAFQSTKDSEELRSLDPAKVWSMVRNGTSTSPGTLPGTSQNASPDAPHAAWLAALMHPAMKRYRQASREAEFLLLNQAAEEVDKLPEQERPGAVAQSLMAGDLALASLLVTLPMPSGWKDRNQNTLLHHAAAAGAGSVATLLMSPEALQAVNKRGDTPLMHAARYGQTAMVSELLRASAVTDARNKNGETALYLAVQAGDVASVGILVQASLKGAKNRGMLEQSSSAGRTPLMVAAAAGNELLVQMLHGAGARVDATSHDGRTALHEAARQGRMGVARVLLQAGAKPNAYTGFLHGGVTPLMEALDNGHYEMAAMLSSRSHLDQRDWRGECALMRAVGQQNVRAAKLLVAAKASVHRDTPDGTTPLMRSAETGNVEMMALLLKAGAVADQRTEFRYSALLAATKNGHTAAVELLLDAKVDSTSKDRDGLTPFMLAASNGHAQVMETLLKKEAAGDVQATKFYGENATMLAAMNGHADVVSLLLRHGMAGNLEMRSGESSETALTQAAAHGHADVVKLLLDAGAHGSLARAERLAKSKGHPKVLHLLVEARNALTKAGPSRSD